MRARWLLAIAVFVSAACGHTEVTPDANGSPDGATVDAPGIDAAAVDSPVIDASAVDAAPVVDASPADASSPDAPSMLAEHVHIEVDNFCNMTISPTEYTVPAGAKLQVSYHNHSVDYPVDVWLSYGGGYTDLATGATWDDRFEHCSGPIASEAYADVSTACSSRRLRIHCQ